MTRSVAAIAFFVLLIGGCAPGKNESRGPGSEELLKGFVSPPNAARPRVWWHWTNGNVTTEGIRKDLLWMSRSGIGGFQNFDASLNTPQIVERRLVYMTSEWKNAFKFTTSLADSLQLEMAIAGSPGWSETGGPWVTAEDGMKKLVWTETLVDGGVRFAGQLSQPPSTTGPFQNIPKQPEFGGNAQPTVPSYYKDVAVVAYKQSKTEIPLSDLKPRIASSGGKFTLADLTDGNLDKAALLARDDEHGFAWIQYEFNQPTTIKAVTLVGGGDRGPFGLFGELADTRALEASDDGKNFRLVTYIPAANVLQQTISFEPIAARYFRVTFKNPPALPNFGAIFGGGASPKPPAGTDIAELVLHTGSRINWAEEKAAFAPAMKLSQRVTPDVSDAVPISDVVDLTSKMNADGRLDWQVPDGTWRILRFGYSLIGKTNHPASSEATGLEVDKLDPDAIYRYFTNYLEQYKSATGGMIGARGLQFLITDSWEAGAQNWTPKLADEFLRRRGYSLVPWMPVLTGKVINSTKESEQFLFDFRNTLSEMVAEYHYDGLTKILDTYGMKRYSESHEDGRAMIADGMDVKRSAAIPMSAMWTPNPFINQNNQSKYEADIRESASVAHLYGQNIAAAESLTALGMPDAAWSYAPETLKPTADLELASGLNRFVIHTSVHQPVDDKIPGLGLGPFGQWFTRHETWAENAKVWTDYLSRSCYLLQQGNFVADALIYYGEDNNVTSLYREQLPAIREGFAYDFINKHALINLLSVSDGKVVTKSGMSYSVLVLDQNAKKMSLPVLKKVAELANAGAMIYGVKPEASPSLSDDKSEFDKLAKEVWEGGRKNVVVSDDLNRAFESINIQPDFSYSSNSGAKLLYVHRTLPEAEIYWINNRSNKRESVEMTFRVAGLTPKLWRAETGTSEPIGYRMENGRTIIMYDLLPADAVFIVFSGKAPNESLSISPDKVDTLSTIKTEWHVTFQPNRGAPATAKFTELKPWNENEDPGIKYFSGTATYQINLEAPAEWFRPNQRIVIDLGDVKNIAEVRLNDQSMGVLWKTPFELNVTEVLKQGINVLEIKVTNLWVNRLIGDAQPGITKKITYTTMPFYQPGSKLLPSGLLGPVKILSISK